MSQPTWLLDLLGLPQDASSDDETTVDGREFVVRDGIIRDKGLYSAQQAQTSDVFGFKWAKRDTFDSEASLGRMREWLVERYDDVARTDWWASLDNPIVLDAGCGAGMSGLALFDTAVSDCRYLGVDISDAVDVAAERFDEKGLDAAFLQADIANLPVRDGSVDVIFSEGVIHHTDDPPATFASLARKLAPGGTFMFYVYRRKGPIREFTDDHVRDLLADMEPQQAWDAMVPLTKLGIALGELNATITIPEDIEILGIPAGPIDVQRLFYWHVAKTFFHPDLSIEEMVHINYDWYAPANAYRYSPEQVQDWCDRAGLRVTDMRVEDAGITTRAVRDR